VTAEWHDRSTNFLAGPGTPKPPSEPALRAGGGAPMTEAEEPFVRALTGGAGDFVSHLGRTRTPRTRISEARMRLVAVLLFVAVGCGKKDEPSAVPPAKLEQPLIRSWKPHTAAQLGYKAEFPLGDPTEGPFDLNPNPRSVSVWDERSVPVTPKEPGQEDHRFGIRAARFRSKPTAAERASAAEVMLRNLPPKGWTSSEPKTVPWAGQQATETTWTDPTKPTKLIVRQFETETGRYVGYVRDTGGLPPANVTRFFDSLQLLGK
jgi:hypothetical protein